MNINQYYITREWQYKNIKPKIICEKFLENNERKPLVDYKFYCFNGNPQMVLLNMELPKLTVLMKTRICNMKIIMTCD